MDLLALGQMMMIMNVHFFPLFLPVYRITFNSTHLALYAAFPQPKVFTPTTRCTADHDFESQSTVVFVVVATAAVALRRRRNYLPLASLSTVSV